MTATILDLLNAAPTPSAERRMVRSLVALHAGRMLMLEPQQFEPLTALDAVRAVPYVKTERADELLRAAGVYPLRLGAQLRDAQREAFAREFARFAKSGVA